MGRIASKASNSDIKPAGISLKSRNAGNCATGRKSAVIYGRQLETRAPIGDTYKYTRTLIHTCTHTHVHAHVHVHVHVHTRTQLHTYTHTLETLCKPESIRLALNNMYRRFLTSYHRGHPAGRPPARARRSRPRDPAPLLSVREPVVECADPAPKTPSWKPAEPPPKRHATWGIYWTLRGLIVIVNHDLEVH